MQVMTELVMLPAMTDHVTVLLAVIIVSPLFSIVNETSMVPHTCITEHVYVTLSSAAAEGLSTTQFGDIATKTLAIHARMQNKQPRGSAIAERPQDALPVELKRCQLLHNCTKIAFEMTFNSHYDLEGHKRSSKWRYWIGHI